MTSYLEETERRELVRQEISRVPGVVMKSDMAMIPCPFHADKTPSCAVYFRQGQKYQGTWYCFGCTAHGLWDKLADQLNLEKFNQEPIDRFSRPVNIDLTSMNSVDEEELVFSSIPKNKKWRGIKTNTLIDVGCKLCRVVYNTSKSDTFIWMPVYIQSKLEGYIKARKNKVVGKTSYINKKGQWAKSKGLFPFDYAIKMMSEKKTVVLVEGQRDALRLIENKIPAMCIMGTHNWNDDKSKLLDLHGVKTVIIMLDGDDAGISGTKLLYPSLKKYLDSVKVIKLWKWPDNPYLQFEDAAEPSKEAKAAGVELWDPFSCPQEVIDFVKEQV